MKFNNDIVGTKFGRLTAVEFSHRKPYHLKSGPHIKYTYYHYYWKFKCDCGKEIISRKDHVLRKEQDSCGCSAGLGSGESLINTIYRTYKNSCANSRNLEFSLSKEDFIELINSHCYYCNSDTSNRIISKYYLKGEIKYNGIDRVDNTKGYTLENSVPCCFICNKAKNNHTLEEFLQWVKKVVEFNKLVTVA